MGVVSPSASPQGRRVVDVLVVDGVSNAAAVNDRDAAVNDATQATLSSLRRAPATAQRAPDAPDALRHTLLVSLVVLVLAALLALGFQSAASERRSNARIDALEALIRDGKREQQLSFARTSAVLRDGRDDMAKLAACSRRSRGPLGLPMGLFAADAPGETHDRDGDGVPDEDDFCDEPRLPSGDHFVSGRATDFDGDGCADRTPDDKDMDNDGVPDAQDECDMSKDHAFTSNVNTDFDGDGCQDAVEDQDDDGDGILNPVDKCEHTSRGAAVDGAGCAVEQLSEKVHRKRTRQKERIALASFEAAVGVVFGAALPFLAKAAKALLRPNAAALLPAAFLPAAD
ncbi:hypothetical protein M885DRAFT_527467 [Pelagophyceae sp. CCMP2097]|nr:hypothetical protein M885DRAFT_527467 [Pelagophyceae sp. CCMP2097]